METFFMGRDFRFFYSKHPFVSFWISGIFLRLLPQRFLPEFAAIIAHLLYFVTVVIGYVFAKEIFKSYTIKNKEILHNLVAYSLVINFFIRRIELTPDLYFNVIAALFLISTYFLTKKAKTINYIITILLGWVLLLTKYQAIIIFAVGFLPFILTKEGRKVILSFKFLLFFALFLAPIILYFSYAISHAMPSIVYAKIGKPKFKYIQAILLPLSTIFKYSILIVLILSTIPVRNFVTKSIINYRMLIVRFDFKAVFLLCNSIVFILIFVVSIIKFKPDGLSRYVYSNIIFIQIFFVFLFKDAISKIENPKQYIKYVLILLTIFFVRDVCKDLKYNNLGYTKIAQNMSNYLQEQDADFDVAVWNYRKYDKIYPYLPKKVYVVEDSTLSQRDIQLLEEHSFILILNEEEPEFVQRYQKLFPNHRQIMISPFEQRIPKILPFQKDMELKASFLLFEKVLDNHK